jgi:VanZ family protein
MYHKLTSLSLPGAFLFLLATAGYAGLTSLQLDAIINDKVLHCLTFFILTTCFYWILDTSRRRSLNFTLLVCTAFLGIGSEILQGFLPNGRTFDFYDIVANIVGSLAALGLSSWYHTRMLERKRLAKHYQAVPDEEQDLELGEGVGAQELGTTSATPPAPTLAEEVDTWDENIEDAWDEEEHALGTDSGEGDGPKTPSASSAGEVEAEPKKRVD